MNQFLRKCLIVMCAVGLGLLTLVPSTRVLSETNKTDVLLNGLIAKDASGRTDEKTATLATGSNVRTVFSLVPQYAEGFTQGTKVHLFLPSFSYDETTDTYRQLGPEETPTQLGISARVSADDTWEVSGNGVQNGGWITLTYSGNLIAGSNPAFEVSFSAYSDGTSGPMGSLPEGTVIDIHGYVEYENYNSQPNSSWKTLEEYDRESVIKLVSSNLTWEATIEHFDGPNPKSVPMWDRYQYIDYRYEIMNTSDNAKSKIEGYTVTFDIDSSEDSINGILPYDINLWRRDENGVITENEDRTDFTGEFVGVPNKGGILIYDITGLSESDPLPEPLSYTYSGVGVIALDQSNGDDKIELGSPTSSNPSKRTYKISLPLSRQGFPNLPTMFNVSAITNIVFAKTQNWSKTDNMAVEIIEPEYLAGVSKTGPNASVYGVETSFKIQDIVNRSNVPFFDLRLYDVLDETFLASKVVVNFENIKDYNPDELLYLIDSQYDELTDTTTHTEVGVKGVIDGQKVTYDISEFEENDLWDRSLKFVLDSRLEVAEFVALDVEIFGIPMEIGKLKNTTTLKFIEKRANNTDYSLETTYEHTENVSIKDDHTIDIIYPDPVKPNNHIVLNSGQNGLTTNYDSNIQLDLNFGLEAMDATEASYKVSLNDKEGRLGIITESFRLHKSIYDVTSIKSLSLIGSEGTVILDYDDLSNTEDVSINIASLDIGYLMDIELDMGEYVFKGVETYITLIGKTAPSIARTHIVTSDFVAHQGEPYNNFVNSPKSTTLRITYPQELKINASLSSSYGSNTALSVYPATQSQSSSATLSLPYEASAITNLNVTTSGVLSPRYIAHFTLGDPTKDGFTTIKQFEVKKALINNSDDFTIKVDTVEGETFTFEKSDLKQSAEGLVLDFVDKGVILPEYISITISNFKTDSMETIVSVLHDATTDLGSTQRLNVTLQGTQNMPYTSEATGSLYHSLSVPESKTSVSIQAYHQEGQSLGSTSFSQYVYQRRSYGYNYYDDYTLDMPYKSLGGFSTSIIRPNSIATNNDERVAISVDVPQEQFDMYSIRLKAALKPYLQSIEIYRDIDGVSTLWKTIDASEWVDNALDGAGNFRINTAHASNDGEQLFMSESQGLALQTHPYYKDMWHEDVKPENPVDKVVVNLKFDRTHGKLPDLAGTSSNVIDTMGRFYEVSDKTKKATVASTNSEIGLLRPVTRTSSATIYSAVHHSYALSETGAQDQASLEKGLEGVQEKVVRMGKDGHFLVGIKNGQNSMGPFTTNNPLISVPTEYNEFIYTSINTFHHDRLIYRMDLPATRSENAIYHFDFTSMHLENSVYKYLHSIHFINADGATISLNKEQLQGLQSLNFDVSASHVGGQIIDGKMVMSFGDGTYVSDVEIFFDEIPGFADSYSEVKGMDEDMLGSRLPVTDIRFTGGVYGNNRLVGTSSLYRQYNGSTTRTLLGTSDAVLIGYTPRLGATVNINQTSTTIHDYLEDGLTPTVQNYSLDVWNSNEVDINKVELQFTSDIDYRVKKISIPQSIFDGTSWGVSSVHIATSSENVSLSSLDVKSHFVLNPTSLNYEMDVQAAFDSGLLKHTTYTSKYNSDVFIKEFVSGIIAVIEPRNTLLYGSLSKELDDSLSNHILTDASEMIVSGIYADRNESGLWDYTSKPSYAQDATKPTVNTHTEAVSNRASAFVTPTEAVYVNNGSANNSQTPYESLTGYLMSRVARLALEATAVDSNLNEVTYDTQFVDTDTQNRISTYAIAPGDQTEQVFEIRNFGVVGNLPVFNPNFIYEVPEGLEIIEFEVIDASSKSAYNDKQYLNANYKDADLTKVTFNNQPWLNVMDSDHRSTRLVNLTFEDQVLDFNESFLIRIKLEVINNYPVNTVLQNRGITWNAFARPDMTHSYMSYDITGVSGNLTRTGVKSEIQNFDGISGNEYYAVVSNNEYRFANPNGAIINSYFNEENISGESMIIETSSISMETHHDNTDVVQEVIFDTKELRGFELTKLPDIKYPEWMNRSSKPELELLGEGGEWTSILDQDWASIILKDVQGVRITYRNMPYLDNTANQLVLPNYSFEGIGYWRSLNPSSSKTYELVSKVKVSYTHLHPLKPSTFEQTKTDSVTIYKAIPLLEFNVQSFDTKQEALNTYDSTNLGKVTYRPGDVIWMKLTANNISIKQGTSTNSAFGKAPLKNPVIVDRIPEYLVTNELNKYIQGTSFNIQQAIADGVMTLEMNNYSKEDRDSDTSNLLAGVREFKLPTVNVHTERGFDVGGAQYFNKSNTIDGSGYLSNNNVHPSNTTINPANEITYTVFTYSFEDEQIDRGGRLEIVYPSVARIEGLPQARYLDDTRAVYAPYVGWNTGDGPVHASSADTIMSMASMLHDVGISGQRDSYIMEGEFLAESSAYLPGTNTLRTNTDIDAETYYDDSANMAKSHKATLKDYSSNSSFSKEGLYVQRSSSTRLSDNWAYVTSKRLESVQRPTNERMLWAQDGLNLSKSWLYSASEMVTKQERKAHDVDYISNYYEHDGNVSEYDIRYHGTTPYMFDNYTYAVQLHEIFNIKMHVSNYGDYAFKNGVVLTEILPVGISPYSTDNVINLNLTIGGETVDPSLYDVKVIQTPSTTDPIYHAPAQSQEYETFGEQQAQGIPYVVQIEVKTEIGSWYNRGAQDSYELLADLEVKVETEAPISNDGISYWYDELRVVPRGNADHIDNLYYEIYDGRYGGMSAYYGTYNRTLLQNDAVTEGQHSNVTEVGVGYYSTRNYIYEPYGRYIRGLNAQTTTKTQNGMKVSVSGDQIAMRKATLRVWTQPQDEPNNYEKSINSFSADLYDEFKLDANVDNLQFESSPTHYRNAPSYTSTNANSEHWRYQPQTIGGAKGAWFDPVVSIDLPYGIQAVSSIERNNSIVFEANLYEVSTLSKTLIEDVTELFFVDVQASKDSDGRDIQNLVFRLKDPMSLSVAYGQGITITPTVKAVDIPNNQKASSTSNPGGYYDDVVTKATSNRPVFNPITPVRYQTGSTPTVNEWTSYAGSTILANDRKRIDSSSSWSATSLQYAGNMAINQRLIKDTLVLNDESSNPIGAYGNTRILGKVAHIKNQTGVGVNAFMTQEVALVDAAGKYWHTTTVTNTHNSFNDKLKEVQQTSDIYHSDFLLTYYVSPYSKVTGKHQLRYMVNGNEYTVDETTASAHGVSIEKIELDKTHTDDGRMKVQFLIKLPVDDRLGLRGRLDHQDSLTFTFESQTIQAVGDDTQNGETWTDSLLKVESYVSLVPVEKTPAIQNTNANFYSLRFEESINTEEIDGDSSKTSVFALDDAVIEVIKPKASVRKNTTRPRIMYSNGKSGDNYFNSSEIIEYMITHAENTGSGVKEMIVEDRIPTDSTHDSGHLKTSATLNTKVLYLSSGKWLIPSTTQAYMDKENLKSEDVFRVYIYVSNALASEDYTDSSDWYLLNPNGNSIDSSQTLQVPLEYQDLKQVRWVVRAMDPDNLLIPSGFKLDIDMDETAEGNQSIFETDPENHSTERFTNAVKENALQLGLIASSDVKHTLYLYNNARLWLNYVGEDMFMASTSQTRSYLTPSRPVVNIDYDASYYRRNVASQTNEDRFTWSDVMIINPTVSPHLKFKATFTNADDSMWLEEESDVYQEDSLINPHITLELPKTVSIVDDALKLVPFETITDSNPLSDAYRSQYALTDAMANQWTWRIERAPENLVNTVSHLELATVQAGAWGSSPFNIFNVGFTGTLYPGDRVIIEIIGTISDYAPGTQNQNMQSSAKITNNTGLLQPLNSILNISNKLGYELDNYDYNGNKLNNDRVVFAERQLFEYSSYDNFSKRKTVYTDLNPAGTTHPNASAVSEGGTYRYEISLDNSKDENANPYPYPMMYDVLPAINDTQIMQNKARNSAFAGELLLDSIKLTELGDTNKVFDSNEYDIFVGPFKKVGSTITVGEYPSHELASTQEFYLDMMDSVERNKYFVNLNEIKNNEELISQIGSMLIMFKDPNAELKGQRKLVLSYEMKARLNTLVYNEHSNLEVDINNYTSWNSFVGTQKVDGFKPQESNLAGVYVNEQIDKTYIGNYVWMDANTDGIQNEGTLITDLNGRKLLQEFKDLDGDGTNDDPGVNGIKVSLLSPKGRHVDLLGQSIEYRGGQWIVVNDLTGIALRDDVFNEVINSKGPVSYITEDDIYGNAGYYTLSNVTAGNYRVMFEAPTSIDHIGVTTDSVYKGTGLNIYTKGDNIELESINRVATTLTVISDTFSIDSNSKDEELMNFDLGLGNTTSIGGSIFLENEETVNGVYEADREIGISGYRVSLVDESGEVQLNLKGKPLESITDSLGNYRFESVPITRSYRALVTPISSPPSRKLSPFIFGTQPLLKDLENDGYIDSVLGIVSHEFTVNSSDHESNNLDFGFYDTSRYSSIGNRVWVDTNRDGIQDNNEQGLQGQTIKLHQYLIRDGNISKNDSFEQTTVTNEGGYYYFDKLPTSIFDQGIEYLVAYDVFVSEVPANMTFTTPYIGDGEIDSDFYDTGSRTQDGPLSLIQLQTEIGGEVIYHMNVDLGLVTHDLGSIHGVVFNDINRNNINDYESLVEGYTLTLQVEVDGSYVDVLVDENGKMIEPRSSESGTVYSLHSSNYSFTGLLLIDTQTRSPYTYRIVASSLKSHHDLAQAHAGDDAIDSDFEFETDGFNQIIVSHSMTLVDEASIDAIDKYNLKVASHKTHVDLGLIVYKLDAILGDTVFNDKNNNGLQDENEEGVSGVIATLQIFDSLLNRWIDTADLNGKTTLVTDESGKYEFVVAPTNLDETHPEYLLPYQYRVKITKNGYSKFSISDLSLDNSINSDIVEIVDEHTAYTRTAVLGNLIDGRLDIKSFMDDKDIDAGLVVVDPYRFIGDKVWHDTNDNGLQDIEEKGVGNIEIILFMVHQDGKYEEIQRTHSDSNGYYEFKVLAYDGDASSLTFMKPFTYAVGITEDSNYRMTKTVNDNFEKDSDALYVNELLGAVISDSFTLYDDISNIYDNHRDDMSRDFGIIERHIITDGGEIVHTGNGSNILNITVSITISSLILLLMIFKIKKEEKDEIVD